MQYKLISNSNYIQRTNDDGVVSVIPDAEANRDWAEYQAWLAVDPENNVPEPADEE